MPLTIVAGPAGGGKGNWIRGHEQHGDVEIDFTRLFDALFPTLAGAVRGDEMSAQLRMTQWLKMAAIRHAVDLALNGAITTSDPSVIDGLLTMTGGTRETNVRIVDPGRGAVIERLRSIQPGRDFDCAQAIERWYGRL